MAGSDLRDRLLALNEDQKAYYESRFHAHGGRERDASLVTNAWTMLRRRIQDYDRSAGVEAEIDDLHRRWCGDLAGRRVLDLGCFTGNPLSLWLAERAGEYVGVDLAEPAVTALNAKLAHLDRAKAVAADILDPEIDWGRFDLIYARSVLHHFEDPRLISARLAALLRPGGAVIGYDPTRTEPLNRLARAAYRPLQSDRAWEWPLTGCAFRAFEEHFEMDGVQGFRGFSKLGLPLAAVPGLTRVAARVGRWGWALDKRLANRRGLALRLCWHVTYRLTRRA